MTPSSCFSTNPRRGSTPRALSWWSRCCSSLRACQSLVEFNKSWQAPAKKNQLLLQKQHLACVPKLSLKDAISVSISREKLVSGAANDSNPSSFSFSTFANPSSDSAYCEISRSVSLGSRCHSFYGQAGCFTGFCFMFLY